MILKDFVFRGERLSDNDCMIAYMVTSPSDSVSMGSKMTHETLYVNSTYSSKKLRAKYEEPIQATFDIYKSDCNVEDSSFSDREMSHIMRWLGSKTSQIFEPIYNDGSYDEIYYKGTFTQIDAIHIGDKVIGFTLLFESENAWGYAGPITLNFSGNKAKWDFVVNCDSDEEGHLAINKTVVSLDQNVGGDFKIDHKLQQNGTELSDQTVDGFDRHPVVVKNCEVGEVLTFDGEYKIITSNKQTHTKLYNDFNYNYPRLDNDYSQTQNIFTVSIPCSIQITYSPIRKVGIIV